MSTTSAEEALQKAREIAARLTGGGGAAAAAANSSPATTTTSPTAPAPTTSTTKRKRWGVAPASNEATGVALPGLEAAAKKLKQQEEPVSKRMWVSTTKERPESHYFVYLPSRILDLVDKIGADGNDEKVTIQLKGRGSSREPPLPGIPEEPMHILIKGNPALVERAELMVDSLLQEADVAPVEELEPLDENAQSMALTVQHQQRSSGYTPATVAQLIHHNPALAAVANGGPLMEEEMKVPNGIVGYLIGRGGETINMLQAKSGCKMQIQKEMDLKPGATERIITLQAASQASIDDCRQMIQKMVDERVRAAGGHVGGGGGSGGGGVKDGRVADALAHGHSLVKMDVPDADVGLIIGKGGSTIKGIQESTGSQVQIPAVGNPDNPSVRTISITCPTQEGAESAKSQIQNVLNSKPTFQERVEQVTIQIPVSTTMYVRVCDS
jgi:far upstream element-binding protein